jgi:hypothetical protein
MNNMTEEQESAGMTTSGHGGAEAKVTKAVLMLNNLLYQTPKDLTCVERRNYKRAPFQKRVFFNSERAFCTFNTGSEYVLGRNSYFEFKLQMDGFGSGTLAGKHIHFGNNGSAMNIIRRFHMDDRTGTEMQHTNRISLLSNRLIRYNNSTGYLQNQGSVMGVNTLKDPILDLDLPNGRPSIFDATTKYTVTYNIPLKWLSGFFDTDQPIPPQVLSAMKLELEFETPNVAFRALMDVPTDPYVPYTDSEAVYKIIDPVIVFDTLQMTDQIAAQINVNSATEGLQIPFRTWFSQDYSNLDSQNLNIQNRKNVSLAFSAIGILQSTLTTDNEQTADSMASIPWETNSWQWRAGNLYFPNQPLQATSFTSGTSDDLIPSTYSHLMTLLGKNNQSKTECGMDVWTDFKNYLNCIPLDLERSALSQVNGLPLNNSRSLELNVTQDSSGPFTGIVFLQYQQVVNAFLDNTLIES